MTLDLDKLREQTDPNAALYLEIAQGCEEQINAQDQEREQGDFTDKRSRTTYILEAIQLVIKAEGERLEHDHGDTIDQRDGREDFIEMIATDLGCELEWSSSHDHESCVAENVAALKAAVEKKKEVDAEVEKALQTVIHWTTDWDNTAASKRVTIIAGLRELCGDALKRMRGERAQTPEERIIYLERALGSIAHTCCNNPEPQQLPYQVRGIVERAIRGVPHPIREGGSDG